MEQNTMSWIEEQEEREDQGWRIEDDSGADWALRKIKEARDDRDRMTEHHKAQMERAKAFCQRTEDYFTGRLAEYFDTVPHNKAKASESYPLPSGKLVYKYPGNEYETDDAALLQWLNDNGMFDYIKAAYSPKWAELKPLIEVKDGRAVLKETGEKVDGVALMPKPGAFSIQGVTR